MAQKLSPRLQAVVDKSEIEGVLAVFARGLDRVDENLLRSVLQPDATLDFGPGIFQGTGSDYVHWVIGVLHGVKSSHHLIGNLTVELEGDNGAGRNPISIPISASISRSGAKMCSWAAVSRSHGTPARRPRRRMEDRAPQAGARLGPTEAVSDIFYHQNPDALWSYRTKDRPILPDGPIPRQPVARQIAGFPGTAYESKSMKF